MHTIKYFELGQLLTILLVGIKIPSKRRNEIDYYSFKKRIGSTVCSFFFRFLMNEVMTSIITRSKEN